MDNVPPSFRDFAISDNSFINAVQLGWYNDETMNAAWVKFDPVDDPATADSVELAIGTQETAEGIMKLVILQIRHYLRILLRIVTNIT